MEHEKAGFHRGRNLLLHPYSDAELEALAAEIRPNDPADSSVLYMIRLRMSTLCLEETDLRPIIQQIFGKTALESLTVEESWRLNRALARAVARQSANATS